MDGQRRPLDRLSVWVSGTPIPQGSVVPVLSKTTGKPFVKQASKKLPAWRRDIVAEVKRMLETQAEHGFEWVVNDEPYALDLWFIFDRPKSQSKAERESMWRWRRPDIDKLVRAVMDALEVAGVLADDARIVDLKATKSYAQENQRAGVSILLRWQAG